MASKPLEAIEAVGCALSALGNSTRIAIAHYLEKEGKATFAEIRDEFEVNDNTIRFHLTKLMDAFLVEQTRSRGPYKLTEFGKETLGLVVAVQDKFSS